MDLGKNYEPGKYGDLSHTEVVYVIKLSAMLCPVEDIQQKFKEFSANTKTIRGSVVLDIQADHAKRIQREAEIYLKNVEGSPWSHPRLVLDMYYEVYRDTRIHRPKQTIKLGPDEWGTVDEPDNRASNAVIDSATKYLRENEKLQLEKLKRNQSMIPTEPMAAPESQEAPTWSME